ncbi:MAG: glycoside hydrolase family 3 C-terminal domain-containing protein, partial [Lachnospiraceae bacterium]|nr:glycoside hydrolase family 3 C-terminal domain-containing protein [Lachnospiraceae bacterium]
MKKTLDWNTYLDTASRTVSEGIVMLTNENHALPLAKDEEVAVFGRIQLHYYKSGTGSGGMVNVSRVISIVDGLTENNVKINETLLNTYKEWEKEHPYELGEGWAAEPWSQKEMPLSDKLVADVAKETSTAIVIIGRTAGEEQDNFDGEGSFRLTEPEWDMLKKVRKSFSKVILLLNVSNIIDMSFLDTCPPDACMYVWAGGMVGGRGTADVLCGKVAPSGKLPDTIAYHLSDYPSSPYFGGKTQNFYSEDIYVGYRYFETFAREKVRFPFGFGLSYTEFDISVVHTSEGNGVAVSKDTVLTFDINVRNTGSVAGKETVQLYCEAPQGKLGKAARVLCGFEKTKLLAPGEEQLLTVTIPVKSLASYDDSGVTGHRFSYVLEAGTYHFYVGNNVRNAALSLGVSISDTVVTEQLTQALAPVKAFKRFKPVVSDKAAGSYEITTEDVPLNEVDEPKRRLSLLPAEIPYTGDLGIKLADVLKGTHSMDEFIGQLSDEDLS